MKNIILFGAPGAGKGTQCAIIKEKMNFAYISTGEILRQEIKKQSPLGIKAKEIIDKGMLVSDDIVIEMIQKFIEANKTKNLLFDGFPRSEKQAIALDKMLDQLQLGKAYLIELQVDKQVLMQRLLNRAKIEGRDDDNEVTITERFKQYDKTTAPVSEYYRKKGSYIAIDGQNGTIEDISKKIFDILQDIN